MKIEIKEISLEEVKKLSPDLIDFNPEKCLGCGKKTGIVQRFFLLNVPALEKFHNAIKKELMNKFGLTYYAFDEGNEKVITTAKCPDCDYEKMEWDY
jgi:hypothetical protein